MRLTSGLFFIFFSYNVIAQSAFGDFILAATNDPTVNKFDLQVDYLNNKPYRLSPLQKLEFRTESNQLDPTRQDYALRVNPANPWELKQNNKYFNELKSTLLLEKGIAFKKVLLTRYNLVVELVTINGLKELAKRKLELTQAYLSILEKQQLSGYFDGEDYVDLKLDEMDKVVDLDKASFAADDAARKVTGLYPEASATITKWNLSDVISIEQIKNIVDSLETAVPDSTTLSYYEKKIDLANNEYNLEKTNINVGYFQAQYQKFRIEQGRKPWSIGLGITIPIVNPNKGDMTNRRLEAIELQQEFKKAKIEIGKDQLRLREELKDLMLRYNAIQEKIYTLNASPLARTLTDMQKSNPVAGVRFQTNLLKLEELVLRLKQNILATYISWLASADVLQQIPVVNYLSKNLETLQE